MDNDTSMAMWEEANINTRSQRTILRYLHTTFGKRSIKISKQGEKGNESKGNNLGKYKSVDPISNVINIEGERIHYWTKPLIPTLSSSIATRLSVGSSTEETLMRSINNVDLVLGGNHGQ